MGTNQPCNSRLTVLKMIDMTLIRWLMTNFKVTVRADCAVSACGPIPLPIHPTPPQNPALKGLCSLPTDCQWGESSFMDVNLGKLLKVVRGGEAWRAAVHGVTKSWARLAKWMAITTTLSPGCWPPKWSKLSFPPTLALEYWLLNGE